MIDSVSQLSLEKCFETSSNKNSYINIEATNLNTGMYHLLVLQNSSCTCIQYMYHRAPHIF